MSFEIRTVPAPTVRPNPDLAALVLSILDGQGHPEMLDDWLRDDQRRYADVRRLVDAALAAGWIDPTLLHPQTSFLHRLVVESSFGRDDGSPACAWLRSACEQWLAAGEVSRPLPRQHWLRHPTNGLAYLFEPHADHVTVSLVKHGHCINSWWKSAEEARRLYRAKQRLGFRPGQS